MKALFIYSNPPDLSNPLRLDKEARVIDHHKREFKDVSIEYLHASEIEDIHSLLLDGQFDVIQFSGHGTPEGIYLGKSTLEDNASVFVDANRIVRLLNLAEKSPIVVVFLSCYSDSFLETLINAAPFVITAKDNVNDEQCITFVQGFYERLFKENSVISAFANAKRLLSLNNLSHNCFNLSRRFLIKEKNSFYIQSKPKEDRDPILVNMDKVKKKIKDLGFEEEEICHQISNKLNIHYWIFDNARENAIIPIGRLLFGEFQWEDKNDVINCTRLIKIRSDVPSIRWKTWSKLLTTYNDLAASEYRKPFNPPPHIYQRNLENAVQLFDSHIQKNLVPLRDTLEEMGAGDAIGNVEFAITECENAIFHLDLKRYPQVVTALESILMNYHELVNTFQPPEEIL